MSYIYCLFTFFLFLCTFASYCLTHLSFLFFPPWTFILLFVFFFSLAVLSAWAPFPCSLILPDSVAFIFMIIQRRHWTAKSLLLPFFLLAFLPLFPSCLFPASFPYSVFPLQVWFIYFPRGFIVLFVIKFSFSTPVFFFLFKRSVKSLQSFLIFFLFLKHSEVTALFSGRSGLLWKNFK